MKAAKARIKDILFDIRHHPAFERFLAYINTDAGGAPIWGWILIGAVIGGALFGYGGDGHDGCPPISGRC